MKAQHGFTLIEAMVGLTILALLSFVAIPGFQDTFERSKVRKTSDLISQLIISAQSEALRRNVKIYVTVFPDDICIGTTVDGCELRKEPLIKGVTLVAPKLVLSPFYGVPSPSPANFTISFSGVNQIVNINRLGVVTVGPLS